MLPVLPIITQDLLEINFHPAGEMFFRAILCNFFVCLAVACGMKCKNEVAKFFMIILCIAGFVVAGFEHCVANMATFVTAALLVPGGISLTAALKVWSL